MSGILNWALEGYKLMLETGLDCPDSVQKATEEYEADNDKIARFISEVMEPGSGYEVRTADAYARFQTWCDGNGFKAGSIQTFKKDIEKVLTVTKKRPKDSNGGGPTPMIVGHQLKIELPS